MDSNHHSFRNRFTVCGTLPCSAYPSGVKGGFRTHDRLAHNQELYLLRYIHHLERVVRIELTLSAWKAVVLPLNYTRSLKFLV